MAFFFLSFFVWCFVHETFLLYYKKLNREWFLPFVVLYLNLFDSFFRTFQGCFTVQLSRFIIDVLASLLTISQNQLSHCSLARQQKLSYHKFFSLSTLFLNYFLFQFKSVSRQRIVSYQTCRFLSTVFFNYFLTNCN